jgi:hypothetical protein
VGSRVELFEQIRRDRDREDWSDRALAARYRVGRRTVKQALESPVPAPRKRPERRPGEYRELIDGWLALISRRRGSSVTLNSRQRLRQCSRNLRGPRRRVSLRDEHLTDGQPHRRLPSIGAVLIDQSTPDPTGKIEDSRPKRTLPNAW